MPLWQERWSTVWLVYAAAFFWVLPGLPDWAPLLILSIAWLAGPVTLVRENIRQEGSWLATASAVAQVAFTVVAGLVFRGAVEPKPETYVGAAVLIGMALFALFPSERRPGKMRPWYGFESLVVVCAASGYLVAMASSSPLSRVSALMMLHGGILSVAVLRNVRIEAKQIAGALIRNGFVTEVWQMRAREPRGMRALLAALCLPSGIVGSTFVLAEAALLMALR